MLLSTPLSYKNSFNTPTTPLLNNNDELDLSFYQKSPYSGNFLTRFKKPQVLKPGNEPTSATPVDMQTAQVAKKLLCDEPTCLYNFDDTNPMENGGFCVCRKQFCSEHFYNHNCSNPPETEILEIFKKHTINPSSAFTHPENLSSAYYSSEQKTPIQKSDSAKTSNNDNIQSPTPIAGEEISSNRARRRAAFLNITPIPFHLDEEIVQENRKQKDLINKIENIQKSIDLITFMVWQKNSPKANYPRPLFTAAPLPKKLFMEQSQNRSREKTISYEETLEFTLQDLVQQLTTVSRYFFDLNKENIEPDQRSQEN